MDFPIENITVPITLDTIPVRKFYVKASAYSNADKTEITVLFEIKNGKNTRHKLFLKQELDQDLLDRTNLRTTLYSACVKSQNKLEVAVNKLMKAVLTSRRHFDPALIGVSGNVITYNARGFSGLGVKV